MKIEDMIELFVEINKVANKRGCEGVEYEKSGSKDYYAVNFSFSSGNAKYNDCLVMYTTDADFNKQELLDDLREIERKAELLSA